MTIIQYFLYPRNQAKCFISINLNYPHFEPMEEVLSLTPLTVGEIEKQVSYTYNLVKIAQPARFESKQPGSRPKTFPPGLMDLPVSLHPPNERACFCVGARRSKSFPPFFLCPAFLNRCLLNLTLQTSILLNYFPLRNLAYFTKMKNEKQKQEPSNPHKIH